MLGGCHSHNAMIYLRGNERDYNEWEQLGNPTWNWRNALKYFKKSEQNKNASLVDFADGMYHSDRGKLIVDNPPGYDPFSEIILTAGLESGYKEVRDFNSGQYVGYGYVQGTIYDGRRQSTLKNFLNSAAKRPNLDIIKKALVRGIDIYDKKATGVRFIYNETNEFVAFNTKEVILSAGSISSPQILMLSGIGPAAHLQRFGIPVNSDLQVGTNLQDHAAVPLFFKFRPDGGDVLRETLDHIYQLAVHNSGPYTGLGVSNVQGFANTVNGSRAKYPDIQQPHVHYKMGTSDLAGYLASHNMVDPAKTALLEQNNQTDVLKTFVTLLRPKSRGTVKLSSRSIYDKPIIDLNLLDVEEDMATLVRGVKYQVAQTRTRVYREYGGQFIRLPIPDCDCLYEFQTDEYYRCYIRQFITTQYHPVGTSKMGPDTDPDAVLDHRLRVKGIKNLRVIDASVMPAIPSANINAATIMIAEKGSDFTKFDWSRFDADYYD